MLAPKCESYLVTEAERTHVSRRARFQQHGNASCHQAATQDAEGNSRHSARNISGICTILRRRQKLGGGVIFPSVLYRVLDDLKQ